MPTHHNHTFGNQYLGDINKFVGVHDDDDDDDDDDDGDGNGDEL